MALPPNQSYTVYVNDPDWAAKSRTGVVVREGQAAPVVDFRLEPGSVIHGRVTAGPRSQPAAGVTVMLFEQGPAVPKGTLIDQPADLSDGATRVADTDSDGRYAFRVGPGEYQLSGPREPGGRAETERIKVGDSQNFRKDYPGFPSGSSGANAAMASFARRKPDGPPIAGAMVVAEPIGDRIPPTHGSADDEGRFRLYRVRSERPWSTHAMLRGISRATRQSTQTMTANSPLSHVRRPLHAAGSSMRGKPPRKRARRLWELWD